jgi:hypothetical protein
MRRTLFGACLFALASGAALIAEAETYHVIICGSGGEPEYSKRFSEWGNRLCSTLIAIDANNAERTILFGEAATPTESPVPVVVPEPAHANTPQHRNSDLETIRAAFIELGTSVTTDDNLIVYLIGHGSFRRNESKFMLPGPDLAAGELASLLGAVTAKQRVVVNTSSSSAGFINVLGHAGLIVCSATKSADEKNATEFARLFVEAFEDGSADLDRDSRISVYEACTQAAALTAAWYKNEKLICTEHALLDDNHDGLGTRLPIGANAEPSKGIDGELAKTIFIKDYVFPPNVPESLVQEYRETLQAVEELKRKKSTMQEPEYYSQLETLLIEAARTNRSIRKFSETAPELSE